MQELCLRISAQYRYSCITSLSPDILKARRSVDHGSRDDLGKVCVSGKSFLLHLYEISVSGSLESTRARRPWKDLRKTDVSGHWLAFWFTNSCGDMYFDIYLQNRENESCDRSFAQKSCFRKSLRESFADPDLNT